MADNETPSPLQRAWAFLDKITPQLIGICLILASYGAVASYFQGKSNERLQERQDAAQAQRITDNEQRTRESKGLLDCIDRALGDLTGTTLPAVRKAGNERNSAIMDFLVGDDKQLGLGELVLRAQRGVKGDPDRDLAELSETIRKLVKADRHLIAVQKANPYPDPPSTSCKLP